MRKLLLLCTFWIIAGTGINAQEKPADSFGALVFYEFSYNTEDGLIKSNEFEFHRIYFTYEHRFSDELNYKFQVDAGRTDGGRLAVFIKNAKVDWNTDFGKIVIGMQGMNVFKVHEENWGYRFLEMSPMDLNKWASSADLGIGYYNTFAGNIHFSTLITNGPGYKNAENDKYKKISTHITYGEDRIDKKDGFNVGGLFVYEPFSFEKDSVTKSLEPRMIYGAYGGYAGYGFRGGVEFDQRFTGGSDLTERIISAYANYKITAMMEIFARFDNLDPNTGMKKDGSNLIIGGLNFTPVKGLSIAPNVRVTTYQDSRIDTETIYRLNFQFKVN